MLLAEVYRPKSVGAEEPPAKVRLSSGRLVVGSTATL